jgi:hypothetical protein
MIIQNFLANFRKQKRFQFRPHIMKKKLLRATGGAVPPAKEKRRELLVRAVPQFLRGGDFEVLLLG